MIADWFCLEENVIDGPLIESDAEVHFRSNEEKKWLPEENDMLRQFDLNLGNNGMGDQLNCVEIFQVSDSTAWVRCAPGNAY